MGRQVSAADFIGRCPGSLRLLHEPKHPACFAPFLHSIDAAGRVKFPKDLVNELLYSCLASVDPLSNLRVHEALLKPAENRLFDRTQAACAGARRGVRLPSSQRAEDMQQPNART